MEARGGGLGGPRDVGGAGDVRGSGTGGGGERDAGRDEGALGGMQEGCGAMGDVAWRRI